MISSLTVRCAAFALMVFLSSSAVLSKQLYVINTSQSEDVEGAFAYTLMNAESGDTVFFDVPDTNTIDVGKEITLSKDLVIGGINKATGERMTIKYVSLEIDGGTVNIRDLFFHEMMYGRYSVFKILNPSTKVFFENVEIKGSYFYDNDYSVSPAIRVYSGATLNLFNCAVSNCSGGGLSSNFGRVKIENSLFENNSSYSSVIGGVRNSYGDMLIINSTIRGNRIWRPGYSGGMAGGAGVANYDGIVTIFNSTISDNSARNSLTWSITSPSVKTFGGGILNNQSNYNKLSICSIFNTTVSGNSAYGSSKLRDVKANVSGGGAYLKGTAYVTNCTFFNNEVTGGENFFSDGPELYYFSNGFLSNNIIAKSKLYYASISGSQFLNGINNFSNDSLGRLRISDTSVVSVGFSDYDLFGQDSVKLDDNGGPTQTISLSQEALANGQGCRTGFYSIDTVISNSINSIDATVYMPVYFNGENWISGQTSNPVNPDISIEEITSDQRGMTRKDPPSVGAFEFTKEDLVSVAPKVSPADKQGFDGYIRNRVFHLTVPSSMRARIQIFTLAGRLVYRSDAELKYGKNLISLPVICGAAVCRVSTPQGVVTKKMISVKD